MNKKTLLVGAVVCVSLVLSFLAINKPATVIQKIEKQVGAIPGSEIQTPDFTVNGVKTVSVRKSLGTGTTTPCQIQGPSATSTLLSATILLTTGSTTAFTIDLATSTVGLNTSTSTGNLTTKAIKANERGSLVWSPGTGDVGGVDPNGFVVWGFRGGLGTFSPAGSCQAEFRVL